MNENELITAYAQELDTNPKYSLEVDPEEKYDMSDEQKRFVKNYTEYKSIVAAAEFTGIDLDTARDYFVAFSSQQEIRRINLAQYQRQFLTRLVSLDEIGGYLTSLLIDNVPMADRLKTAEKLKVAQMIIDLNKMKIDALYNPKIIMEQDIDKQLNDLSIATIQDLLAQSEKTEKPKLEGSSLEESAYLNTLSTDELLEILESVNKENDT